MKLNRKSRVYRYGQGQWARQKSTGANLIIEGAKRSRIGLLVVARITSGHAKGRYIEAKASSLEPRKSGPKRGLAPLALLG